MSKKKSISKSKQTPRKRKSTAKFKGVRYIAQKLNKYFPKKYPTYSSALSKARELKDQFDKEGKKVIVVNIFDKVRKHRGPKEPDTAPFVPEEMFEPIPFWEMEANYPDWIGSTSNKVKFISSISPIEDMDIPGGSNIDAGAYEKHFKDFENFGNAQQQLMRSQGIKVDSPKSALVVTTRPRKEPKGPGWYCEIIPCDETGSEMDYGWDPEDPKANPTDIKTPEVYDRETPDQFETEEPLIKSPGTEPTKQTPGPISKSEEVQKLEIQERIKAKDIELAKVEEKVQQQKTLQQLMGLVKDGVLPPSTITDFMKTMK
jgi:hypothetical protein